MLKKLCLLLVCNFIFITTNAACQELEIYGTDKDFAKNSIYFVITDRFVDGDKSNNYETQGGKNPTWKGEIKSADGKKSAYIGYLGGDFKGLYENAEYIRNLGFDAVWITPIVDNPNQSFTGGKKTTFSKEDLNDGGKSGFHGYWGMNFFKEDEHLVSRWFSFKDFTKKMHKKRMKVVLDIVCNHSSPAYTMPAQQGDYGKVFDKNGKLVADHKNLLPQNLDHTDSLQKFYNKKPGLAQLGDFNENNPAVMDYLTEAYLQWIEQGADAFRIDTYAWMPHSFWREFSKRIRAKNPEFFMFGEVFSYDDKYLAKYQLPENGDITIFDFYLQKSMVNVFNKKSVLGYDDLLHAFHLDNGVYTNPYELVTFYDNHDMSRFDGDEEDYIDIHNLLFTMRGIPCLYYGSEIGFMSGTSEHNGSRNYYGIDRIKNAPKSKIYKNLQRIATIRKYSVSLQKGRQVNIDFKRDTASFLRIYQKDGINQSALVLLNKGDEPKEICVNKYISKGVWKSGKVKIKVTDKKPNIKMTLAPHSAEILFFNKPINNVELINKLTN